jgi:hypothetical protein
VAIKKQAPAPASEPIRNRGPRALDDLAPLELSAVTVASAGIVRAAFDAVAEHPLVVRSAAAARASGREASERHVAASASLARRSAESYARSLGAVVTPASVVKKPSATAPPRQRE